MEKVKNYVKLHCWLCACVILIFAGASMFLSKSVEAVAEMQRNSISTKIIIDAGHGGEDGGATSCTGTLESKINLDISKRLDDLLHLLGFNTIMIRTTDSSVSTNGETISQRKMSDLKNRVNVVNTTGKALLVSIHQNIFSDSKYYGAQVFYSPTANSKTLARKMQDALIASLNPDSRRESKASDGVYLMQHIRCTGILVECGFLSNPNEAVLLESPAYQQKVACVIASVLSNYLNS